MHVCYLGWMGAYTDMLHAKKGACNVLLTFVSLVCGKRAVTISELSLDTKSVPSVTSRASF